MSDIRVKTEHHVHVVADETDQWPTVKISSGRRTLRVSHYWFTIRDTNTPTTINVEGRFERKDGSLGSYSAPHPIGVQGWMWGDINHAISAIRASMAFEEYAPQ